MFFCDEKKAVEFASNPGDPIHEIYGEVVDVDGSIKLVPIAYENTDDIIASQADSTDIHTIIARFRAGDLGALNQRKGIYGDFTEAPKTYAEALQMQIDGKRAFDKLPVELKKKFDNDYHKFLASAGSDEWLEKLEAVMPKEEKVVDDKKDGENK